MPAPNKVLLAARVALGLQNPWCDSCRWGQWVSDEPTNGGLGRAMPYRYTCRRRVNPADRPGCAYPFGAPWGGPIAPLLWEPVPPSAASVAEDS